MNSIMHGMLLFIGTVVTAVNILIIRSMYYIELLTTKMGITK